MKNLKEEAKKLPNSPGVYLFESKGKTVYVGRAASLKKRLANYFSRRLEPIIAEMVKEADRLTFRKTAGLLEAAILEANLIKKHWPKYNVRERDNRSFVYLVVPLSEPFPKPVIARGREIEKYRPGGAKIFGPYQSYRLLKTVLSLARRIFPFSTCSPHYQVGRGKRPCFYRQIELCPGVCTGEIAPADYRKNISGLISLFSGQRVRLLKKLKKENPEKAAALKYVEDAALLAEFNKERKETGRIEGYDISHLAGSEPVGAMVVFSGGRPDKSRYRLFKIKNAANRFNDLAMLKEVLERRFRHREWPFPDVVLVDGGKNQTAAAKRILGEFRLFLPVVGVAKTLGRAASASSGDKFFFANIKPSGRLLLSSSKKLFQEVRNEAHRFALSFQRRRRRI